MMTSKMTAQPVERVEAVWLSETEFCSLDELAALSGLSHAELSHLMEMGVIEPNSGSGGHVIFQQQYLVVARTARRLRDDFELDTYGLAVAVSLLQRIEDLKAQLNSARAQLMHGRPSSDT